MNDIAYVQCNSRLEQKSKIRTTNFDPTCMEDISKFDAQWILEDDPQVLNAEELDRFWKGLMPNDQEICNAMNDEDQWIDNGYDTDASQDNDETSNPTPPANQGPIDGARGEENIACDDDYGHEEHHANANVTD